MLSRHFFYSVEIGNFKAFELIVKYSSNFKYLLYVYLFGNTISRALIPSKKKSALFGNTISRVLIPSKKNSAVLIKF